MSSQVNPDWSMLGHDLIFKKIMMMVGLDSLESLHSCRQVCPAWDEMIMKNIWENKSKRNIIKIRIERIWGPEMLPSDEDISHAKWLGNNNIGFIKKHSNNYSPRNKRHPWYWSDWESGK